MLHFDLTARFWLRRIAVFLLVVAAIWACVAALRIYGRGGIAGVPVETVAPIAIKQTPASADSHLQIAVAPPVDRLGPGQSAPLHLLLENDGGIQGRFTPSAVAAGGCIQLDIAKMQSSLKITPDGKGAPGIELGPHATATLDIPVDTTCAGVHLPHSEMMQLAYTWSTTVVTRARGCSCKLQPRAGKSQRGFTGLISTSPLTVTSPAAEGNRRALHLALLLAQDFTWPVLLALLAALSQGVLARRAERQQIFTTLLPVYTELVQAHYLPITRRMEIVQAEAKKIHPPRHGQNPDIALQRTFCAILLMRSRALHLLTAKGGVFFRSSIAEELFAACFSGFYLGFQRAAGDAGTVEACAAALDPDFTLSQCIGFVFSFAQAAVTAPLFAGFSARWVNVGNRTPRFNRYLTVLDLAKQVMSFECDRIFYEGSRRGARGDSTWYFDPPQFEFSAQIGAFPRAYRTRVARLLTAYLNGIPGECKKEATYL